MNRVFIVIKKQFIDDQWFENIVGVFALEEIADRYIEKYKCEYNTYQLEKSEYELEDE